MTPDLNDAWYITDTLLLSVSRWISLQRSNGNSAKYVDEENCIYHSYAKGLKDHRAFQKDGTLEVFDIEVKLF